MIPVKKSYIIDDAIALTMHMSTTSTDIIDHIIDDGTPMETADGASTPAEDKTDLIQVNQLQVPVNTPTKTDVQQSNRSIRSMDRTEAQTLLLAQSTNVQLTPTSFDM